MLFAFNKLNRHKVAIKIVIFLSFISLFAARINYIFRSLVVPAIDEQQMRFVVSR